MKWSWKIGSLAGIDVRVHATFFLLIAWVAWSSYQSGGTLAAALGGVLFVALLFAIVVLHELGHALTARRFGVPTRDITLLPIGGVARLERMPENPRHELAVALAGPAVNVVLAAVLAAAAWMLGIPLIPEHGTPHVLAQLVGINVALAAFNLLPAFPMDGGRALRAILALRMDGVRATEYAARLGQALAVGFGILGLFASPVLLFIAIFVWFGARAEATGAQVEAALSGIQAETAAIRDFKTLHASDRVETAVDHVLHGFQHDFPVVEGDEVVGVLPHRALLRALRERGADTPIGRVMEKVPGRVRAWDSLDTALRQLHASEGRCLLVTDAEDRVVGLLTTDGIGELVAVRDAMRPRRGLASPRPRFA